MMSCKSPVLLSSPPQLSSFVWCRAMKGHKTGFEISYPCKSVSRDGSPQHNRARILLSLLCSSRKLYKCIMSKYLRYFTVVWNQCAVRNYAALDITSKCFLLFFKMPGFVSYWTWEPGVKCQRRDYLKHISQKRNDVSRYTNWFFPLWRLSLKLAVNVPGNINPDFR